MHDANNVKTLRVINEGVLISKKKRKEEEINDPIVVQTDKANTKTGITCGWVVKTGPGYHIGKYGETEETWKQNHSTNNDNNGYIPIDISVGDIAYFFELGAAKIVIKGVEYCLVKYHDILLIDGTDDT